MRNVCRETHFRTIPLRTVLFQSTDDANEVTLLPLDILDAGLEVIQFN